MSTTTHKMLGSPTGNPEASNNINRIQEERHETENFYEG